MSDFQSTRSGTFGNINRAGFYVAVLVLVSALAWLQYNLSNAFGERDRTDAVNSELTEFVSDHGVDPASFGKPQLKLALERIAFATDFHDTRVASIKMQLPLSYFMSDTDYATNRKDLFNQIETKYANLAEQECASLKLVFATACAVLSSQVTFNIVDEKQPVASGFAEFQFTLKFVEHQGPNNISKITRSKLFVTNAPLPPVLGNKGEYRINPFEEAALRRKAYYQFVAAECERLRLKEGNCAILHLSSQQKPTREPSLAFDHGVNAKLGALQDTSSGHS